MRFRTRPVVIEAVQWTGDNFGYVLAWSHYDAHLSYGVGARTLAVVTLEGLMVARPGDWIICGVRGEFYPCKPDIFALTHEPLPPRDLDGVEPPNEDIEIDY